MSQNGNGFAPHQSPTLVDAVADAVARKVEERRKINAISKAVLLHLRENGGLPAPEVETPEPSMLPEAGGALLCQDFPLVFGSPPEAAGSSSGTYTRNLVRALNRLGYAVRVTPEYAQLRDAWEYRRLLAAPSELHDGCVVELGQTPATGARRVVLELVDMFRAHRNSARYMAADLTLTTSDYSLQEIRRVGVDPLRSACFPLGVDTQRYHPEALPWNWRRHLVWHSGSLPKDPFVVLAHGFWQERKGLRFALEAFRTAFAPRGDKAANDRSEGHAPLLLIKSVPRLWGQSVRELVEAAAAAGLHVALTETELSEAEMPGLYTAADVVLHLHRLEAFGLIPLEAMACGRPVILTDYSGVQEYATPEGTVPVPPRRVTLLPEISTPGDPVEPAVADAARGGGYRWAVPDVQQAAQALHRLYLDAALRTQLGSAGRARAGEFTWERAAAAMVERCEDHGIAIRRKPQVHRVANLISVCVPVYNSLPDLQRLLRSLLRCGGGPAFEVVVVDDGSAENLWEWLQRFAREELRGEYRLRPERSRVRRGVARSRTHSWWSARGEFLCSIDCDTEVTDPQWLRLLKDGYTGGVTGGKLLTSDGRLQHAGVTFDPQGMPSHHRSYRETDAGQCDVRRPVAAVTGALQFFHGSLLEELGGPYTGYGEYGYEDVDWCLEVRRLGYPVIYDPAVRLIHHEGSFLRAGGKYDVGASYRAFMERWPPSVIRELCSDLPEFQA